MKTYKFTILLILISISSCKNKIELDKKYCSNNENSATKIAEKEWLKIYGKEIYKQTPFIVKLKNDTIWVVEGTLPENSDGGVPYAEINAKTCEILKIIHGK